MLKCSSCSVGDLRVTSTYNDKVHNRVVRRRVCQNCEKVCFTIEQIAEQEKETGFLRFLHSIYATDTMSLDEYWEREMKGEFDNEIE
ncbi:MAG: hypothetical protein J6S67_13510 [Methanobrevibacter sp.]|nr:hypothetical protein [Methanobrevibacter sp.]